MFADVWNKKLRLRHVRNSNGQLTAIAPEDRRIPFVRSWRTIVLVLYVSFSNRAPLLWNSLPVDVREASSPSSFNLSKLSNIREVLQNEFRYDFRKGPRDISAGTVITVLKAIMHVNTVITVPAEISRGPFRKSYRNSFCKTSLLVLTTLPSSSRGSVLFLVFTHVFFYLAHVSHSLLLLLLLIVNYITPFSFCLFSFLFFKFFLFILYFYLYLIRILSAIYSHSTDYSSYFAIFYRLMVNNLLLNSE